MKKHSLFTYALLFLTTFSVDRVTKYWATTSLLESYPINNYFSFELVYNRGVTWSFFDFTDNTPFLILTVIIALIIAAVTFYTYIRWMNHYTVIGEVLVLSGALSNLLDRITYGGVIDFIYFSINGWSWPIFNLADVWIVSGVLVMLILNSLNE
jgi:signal peptidase II